MTQWAEWYAAEDTPWDCAGPHPELVARFERKSGERTALIPGCGFGHDALHLAQSGLRVVALDLVEQLEKTAGEQLRAAGGTFHVCDAFEWESEEQFDVVFEHTFLCAIEPELRGKWAALMRRSVKPGGRFLAIAFPGGKAAELGGPPHGYSVEDLGVLLGPSFTKTFDEAASHSLERREWEERWVEFVRTG